MRRKQLNFGDAQYWEDLYVREEAPLEWYQSFSVLEQHLAKHLTPLSRILVDVGIHVCSPWSVKFRATHNWTAFSADLYEKGYHQVANMDISPSVVSQMKKKHPEMEWDVMDLKRMTYPAESFDAVIDKGTFDAIMCGATENTHIDVFSEIHRVLKPNGSFLLFSNGTPLFREDYFTEGSIQWQLKYERIDRADGPDDERHRYIYFYAAKKE